MRVVASAVLASILFGAAVYGGIGFWEWWRFPRPVFVSPDELVGMYGESNHWISLEASQRFEEEIHELIYSDGYCGFGMKIDEEHQGTWTLEGTALTLTHSEGDKSRSLQVVTWEGKRGLQDEYGALLPLQPSRR